MAVKIDTLETVAAECGHRGEAWQKSRCSKFDHLLRDGSVRLDFMTDDVNEAEEVRNPNGRLWCGVEVRNSNESAAEAWLVDKDRVRSQLDAKTQARLLSAAEPTTSTWLSSSRCARCCAAKGSSSTNNCSDPHQDQSSWRPVRGYPR